MCIERCKRGVGDHRKAMHRESQACTYQLLVGAITSRVREHTVQEGAREGERADLFTKALNGEEIQQHMARLSCVYEEGQDVKNTAKDADMLGRLEQEI